MTPLIKYAPHPNARIHSHTLRGIRSATYRSWGSMMQRCTNPKCDNYARYGGRGIKVCKRWQQFSNFLADMGVRPDGLTLERIDNDGNYEPGNCRWATRAEQNQNTRYTIRLNGKNYSTRSLAAEYGISYRTMSRRLTQYGLTPEEAICTALGRRIPRV